MRDALSQVLAGEPETPADLRACLRDLVSLVALPALWTGREPAEVVRVFLGVAMEVLHADWLYVRCEATAGGVEECRARDGAAAGTLAVGRALREATARTPLASAVTSAVPPGGESVRVVRLPLGVTGDEGELVIACRRPEYPSGAERLLARVAANQLHVGLVQARLYQALQEAVQRKEEADRRKDEFLAMLGHELRNPLSPIMTALQLMRLRGDQQLDRERLVIERQVRHLERLVDDLLDVSRVTRGKVELRRAPIELGEVVAQAIESASPLMEQKKQRLEVSVQPRGLLVDVDRVRLAQVITNLLTNAAKYTPERGEIAVFARPAEDSVVLSVRDTGEGISPELLPHVFDMFVQAPQTLARSQGGLGLGLTIAKRLVELHGGRIEAHSDGPGKGSRFEVHLPALAASAVATDAAAGLRPAVKRPAGGCRVLVVDDNRDAAELLAAAVSAEGYEVCVAFDGPAALEEAEEFRPHIVLLDIGLPVLDGYEVARRLRARPWAETTRLIAITGYGQESDRARAAALGFDRHLVKPVDLGRLFEALRTVSPDPAIAEGA